MKKSLVLLASLAICISANAEQYVCDVATGGSDSSCTSYVFERQDNGFLMTMACRSDSGVSVTERFYHSVSKSNSNDVFGDLPSLYVIETQHYLSFNILNVIGLHTHLIDKTAERFETTELYGPEVTAIRGHGFCFVKR